MNQAVSELIKTIALQLTPIYGSHESELNAWHLLEHLTQIRHSSLRIQKNITLSAGQEQQLATWITDIVLYHKPIQYIIGSVPFLDLTIAVRPPFLIPRPETEEWCAHLIQHIKKNLIPFVKRPCIFLDLCTGTGCIALALAKAFPSCIVYASDISTQALELAQENAALNNIKNISFIQSDLYAAIPSSLQCDCITANPPYISEEEYIQLEPSVQQWEDKKALVADDEGLALIKKIVGQAPHFLCALPREFPQLWVEIGYAQAESVRGIFKQNNFEPTILKDLQGNDRVVVGNINR